MATAPMYLIDTNVISESRKRRQANTGVQAFFKQVIAGKVALCLSVITVGELRRGLELVRRRGDRRQAERLDSWISAILSDYAEHILDFGLAEAQVWGYLRSPHHENALDKQIAATALTHELTLVTRNVNDFSGLGVNLLNPFE